MTDKNYFHISEVPEILKGLGCDIYHKTKLPYGMIDGTNAENFFIRVGGLNCRHSINPVAERQVPKAIRDEVYLKSDYIAWSKANGTAK